MDLGIRGKKAIVCASSRGLGKGCAEALAEAGCDLVVNGRDADVLARTAQEIRDRFGVEVIEVSGDVADPAIQKKLVAALPQVDILVNNNGGPPYRPFKELDREAILKEFFATDEERMFIAPARPGPSAGWFQLIYGNDGWDVIADHLVTPICVEIMEELDPLIEKFEREAA